MIKSVIFILILLLIFPIISAVEVDMETNFSQGQTLMARVSGNFLETIFKENIFFYRRHFRTPMDFDVGKIDNEFYIYAQLLDKIPDNYSLVIKNAKYMKGSQISEEDIVKNFSIIESIADFSINPGFIITDDDFFIEVQNLQDYKITIQIKTDITNNSTGIFIHPDTTILNSGEIKKIDFELKDIEQSTVKTIELSTENLKYQILVYVFVIKTEPEKKPKGIKFEPSEFNVTLSTNFSTTRIVYLYNTGNETLENISLSMSDSLKPYISFSIEEIDELKESSNVKIELYISSDDEEKTIEGKIKAKTSENIYADSEMFLNFVKDFIPFDEDEDEDESEDGDEGEEVIISTIKTCLEINGKICNEDEECDGELIYAKDDVCCLGNCEKIKKSSTGKIIGWSIVIGVIILVIWFYMKKYRKAKKPINLLKIAKGKRK